MRVNRFDIHQHITDKIVNAIERGAGDFRLPGIAPPAASCGPSTIGFVSRAARDFAQCMCDFAALRFAFLATESNDLVRPVQANAMSMLLTTAKEWDAWLTAQSLGGLDASPPAPTRESFGRTPPREFLEAAPLNLRQFSDSLASQSFGV